MRTNPSRITLLCLLCTPLALAQSYSPDQPAFSASPTALRESFAGLEAGSNPITVLLEAQSYEFEAPNRYTARHHLIFKAWTKAGAEQWSVIERNWAPWQEERPTVRARVIAPDGTVHELDPKTIGDSPVRDNDDDVLTDRRMIRAPLPAIEAGSVVEQEVVEKCTQLPAEAGVVRYFEFGSGVPVERTILRIRGPESIPFRFQAALLPDLKTSDRKEGGAREITFEYGPLNPREDPAWLLPPAASRWRHVEISTARDWNTVAVAYAGVVEAQLKGFNAASYLPKFGARATREEKIQGIVDWLNTEIRYTGIEFSEASVVPRPPAEVLQRKFGDCKDKSTLGVALLRAAGIQAYVALLNSSLGRDIDPGLPAMGSFNHAIVYVPGQPDIWLDPTDPDLRLHVISPPNQNRLALIARPETTDLIATPELTAQENRVVETREFWLAELGRAKVIETSETYGTPDRNYRGMFGDRDEKALRESLKDYVDYTYGEAKIAHITHSEGADLKKPFELKIEMDDAQRGTSARTEAAVGIFLSQIALRLPEYFRTEPKKEKEEVKPAPSPRTEDFYIPESFTHELHYIIHAPAGFRIRQLPEAKEEKLGPATLIAKYKAVSDTEVLADFAFVMPKRRFTAGEGLALRDAVLELGKRHALLIYFDQTGETDLASGRVKEALVEFAKLRKLHPQEALHALQTARALLAAGAGEAARAEARRAVALEPSSSKAYVQLAEILKHDLVGRPMEKGFDGEGAVAAYRKALELDPDDHETRANLAILLEYNKSGERYGAGARMDEALAEYKKIADKLADLSIPQNYPIAMLQAGHMQELKDYVSKQPTSENSHTLAVCAEAVLNGSKAAFQRAGEVSGVEAQRRILASAGRTLMGIRQYQLAADLLEAAAVGSDNPSALGNLVKVLRQTKRIEDGPAVLKQPEDAVRVLMIRAFKLDAHEKDWMETLSPWMMDAQTPSESEDFRRGVAAGKSKVREAFVTLEEGVDLMQSALQFSHDGSDETGWVIRMAIPSASGSQDQVFFVIKENGTYRLVGGSGEFEGIGRLVLHLADIGEIDHAKIWLDRLRQELHAGSGDDPLDGPLFARLWQEGQAAEPETIRIAAASLLTGRVSHVANSAALAILEAAGQHATGPSANALWAALADSYFSAKQYSKALPIGERLLKELPHSNTALAFTLRAAYAAGGSKEAARVAAENLDRFKNNTSALRAVASAALGAGDTERSRAIDRQLIDSGRAQAADYNELAWADLMAGAVTAESIEMANKGLALGGGQNTALLHTLAAVDAEMGKEADARSMLLQRMKLTGYEEPDGDEWYVFARIAEQYGLTHEAASMYRKVTKPSAELSIPASSYNLAQRRLKAIGE